MSDIIEVKSKSEYRFYVAKIVDFTCQLPLVDSERNN
jgi:hypothetical protein